MKRYTCRIPVSPKNTAVLKLLNAEGKLLFDEYVVARNAYILMLTTEEIQLLKVHEVKAERFKPVPEKKTAVKKKIKPAKISSDDSDDFLVTGFVDAYLDAAEVAARISSLAAEFPALCQLSVLPNLTSGYDGLQASLAGPAQVQLLRITNNPADHSRPGLLLICGTHAREWINPLIAIEFAEQLLRNYNPLSADPDIVNISRIIEEGDIFIVPVMNPDGLNFSRHDDADWRKNRRVNSAPACPGVDNNRNYEVYFGEGGSSASECSDAYHGPAAFSEPENKNIRYILEQYPNILIGVDSHSAGEEIFRPTIDGGTFIATLPVFPADEAIYQSLETAALNAIQAVSGKIYGTGTTSNHAGTSDEFMFFAHRIFGFDFECALSFQPPIATAQVSVQEVTAALRALAIKAVDLDLAAVNPVNIVQCIDRTGSMIAFGYEDAARANASRFVDMMSIGDKAAVVSFADPAADPSATPAEDRAQVEFPLTLINDAGDYGAAINAIDNIVFGGWTSIGAGLSQSADLLTGATGPKAIVLLSDGYENRDPSAASVLSSFPSGVRVFTIALGSVADVPLMQDIAMQTGGLFYQSPDALELHEIYNHIRAGSSDDDLLFSKMIPASEDDYSAPEQVYVETGASLLRISLSWESKRSKGDFQLIDPAGRIVKSGDWGVRKLYRTGYVILELLRPMPGHWTIQTQQMQSAHVLAAFLRSPLKIRLQVMRDKKDKRLLRSLNLKISLPKQVKLNRMSGTAMLRNLYPVNTIAHRKAAEASWTDQLPKSVANCRPSTLSDPQFANNRLLAVLNDSAQPVSKKSKESRFTERQFEFSLSHLKKPGLYQVDIQVEGLLNGRMHFERRARFDFVV